MATKILQIIDSLVKQAENANTLGGKSAEEFALTSDIEDLQTQINSKWNYVRASCVDYADLDSVLQNLDVTKANKTIMNLTITSGGELNTDLTAKNNKDTHGKFLGIPYLYENFPSRVYGVKLICLEDNSLWNYIPDNSAAEKSLTKLSDSITIDQVLSSTSENPVQNKVITEALNNVTPVKGVDYYTAEDKAEFEAFIIEELEKRGQLAPEFANSIEECTDVSKMYVLPDGYIYAYTSHEEEVFTNVLEEVGYQDLKRINSSGVIKDWETSDVTGYIPVEAGDIIRLKNVYIPDTYNELGSSYSQTAYAYTSDKTFLKSVFLCAVSDASHKALDRVVENGGVVQFTVASEVFGENVAYIIIGAAEITETSEIYVNSTIVETQGWENTGLTFVSSDYGEQIADHETRLKLLEANEDGSGVPEYWLNEIETKAQSIQCAMETAGRNKSAFLWYTDAHWTSSSKMSPILLDYLCKNTPINKVNFGGDIIGDPTEYTHENIKYAYEWRKLIAGLPNHHSVIGNHDANHNTTDVSKIAYSFLNAPEETADMIVGGDFYYYIDNPSEKTRYLYLSYLTNNHTEMMAQGEFIVDAIKSAPENWHIVAIAHRWFQYTSSSAPTVGSVPRYESEILKIFDEYNARTTHTASNYFTSQDFADGKAKVEFCIGGHIHTDFDFKTDGGIPVIITTSDTNQDRVPENEVDSGTLGTTTESAVFGIIADYSDSSNTKITVIGVGRGTSRVIDNNSSTPIEPENPIEPDEPVTENLFNKDDPDVLIGGRLNSSKQRVYFDDGQLLTGYIEAKMGDTFTITTDKANNTNSYTGTLIAYNADKTTVVGAHSNPVPLWNWSSDYKTGTITIGNHYDADDFSGTAFVSFCVAYTDIDSITITKGQTE